jgi:hypothetical protein
MRYDDEFRKGVTSNKEAKVELEEQEEDARLAATQEQNSEEVKLQLAGRGTTPNNIS